MKNTFGRTSRHLLNPAHKRGLAQRTLRARLMQFARRYHYEKDHALQVTRLALQLFDQLRDLHRLDEQKRMLLEAAGLLHDIGWIQGRVRHHKTSRDIIMTSSHVPLKPPERRLVALVVRYHRRALPQEGHKYFCDLSTGQKEIVKRLAALLRVADGLDWGHISSVKALRCRIHRERIVIMVESRDFLLQERRAAHKKGDLFRRLFRKPFMIRRVFPK